MRRACWFQFETLREVKILSIKLYTSSEGRMYEHTCEGLARQRKTSAIPFGNTSKSVSIY